MNPARVESNCPTTSKTRGRMHSRDLFGSAKRHSFIPLTIVGHSTHLSSPTSSHGCSTLLTSSFSRVLFLGRYPFFLYFLVSYVRGQPSPGCHTRLVQVYDQHLDSSPMSNTHRRDLISLNNCISHESTATSIPWGQKRGSVPQPNPRKCQ